MEHTTDFMRPSSEKEFYILIPKTELEADAKLYAHFTWMEAKGEKCVKWNKLSNFRRQFKEK